MTQDIHSFASVGNLYQKCISLVRIRLQTRKTAPKASHRCKKASTKFRKTLESKIAPIRFDGLGQEKSLEISVFLPCGETQGGFLVYPVAMMGGIYLRSVGAQRRACNEAYVLFINGFICDDLTSVAFVVK